MPGELWKAAIDAAREHGVWAVSQALRVNYESLKARLNEATSRSVRATAGAAEFGFVELGGGELLASCADDSRTVVELTSRAGAKVVIRLGAREALDALALVRSLWSDAR